jgi:transglutaminase-like putative cysteine protease
VVCSATALSGVITGLVWLVHVTVAVAVITATGVGVRATRLPLFLVPIAQLLALACLLVTIFTRSGVLLVLPGPQAVDDLLALLGDSITEVQSGVPPVASTPAMTCLVLVAIGLVAVLVDNLAVSTAAPAASGLVLLCVFAVPASLAEEMLPVWTFVLGAASFALLLAVDGQHRHRAWRGRGGGVSSGSGPAATSVAAVAVVIALLAGASLTFIGTVGRLPGADNGIGVGNGGMGIKPMTKLRGLLDQGENAELFHVRGLRDPAYMRVSTLREYVPGEGWIVGPLSADSVPAGGDLPLQAGDPGGGEVTRVDIDPVGWSDNWLPTYGRPRRAENLDENWRFDPSRGVVFSERARRAEPFSIETVLEQPSAEELRAANGLVDVERGYTEVDGVDDQVVELARSLTRDAGNQFDRAAALSDFFTDPVNGFTYSTETSAPVTSDALTDFVVNGKTGFCEQYASAMAVMARVVGLPSRVAVGFTSGYPAADHRTITNQDAHAWVEIYFPGHGWTVFDPTPLGDGRGVTPPYMRTGPVEEDEAPTGANAPTTTTAPGASSAAAPTTSAQAQDAPRTERDEAVPAAHVWVLAVTGVLALIGTVLLLASRGGAVPLLRRRRVRPLLTGVVAALWVVFAASLAGLLSWWLAVPLVLAVLAAAPAVVRTLRRRERLHAVASLGPAAANAAWQELMAESVDRGTRIASTETVRSAARRLVREHNLDEQGRDGLRSVVGAVEQSWYSARPGADPALPAAVDEVRRSMARNAPLALRAKVLPRSVLQPAEPERFSD